MLKITVTQTISENVDVYECPYCGSSRIEIYKHVDDRYYVCCNSCRSHGPLKTTQHAAVDAWNKVAKPMHNYAQNNA